MNRRTVPSLFLLITSFVRLIVTHGASVMIWRLPSFYKSIQQYMSTLPSLPSADAGGWRTSRCYRMDVELAGRPGSSKCPKHSSEAHKWPGAQLGKKHGMKWAPQILFYTKEHRGVHQAPATRHKTWHQHNFPLGRKKESNSQGECQEWREHGTAYTKKVSWNKWSTNIDSAKCSKVFTKSVLQTCSLCLCNNNCFSGALVMMDVTHEGEKNWKGKLIFWQWERSQSPSFTRVKKNCIYVLFLV